MLAEVMMASRTPVSKTAAKKPAVQKPVVAKAPSVKAAAKPKIEAAAAEQPVWPVVETAMEKAAVPGPAKTHSAAAKAAPAQPKEVTKMEATIKTAAAKGQAYFADLNEFNKGNVEALVESSKIAATGLQSLGQGYADYARRQFEGVTATMKSFAGVKSPTELMTLHADFVRGQFDSLVAETSKNTEAMLKLAGDVAKPISNRVALAAEKLKVAA
ncbi:MAG TPA: phasin family protein [Sphingomonas sp.]|nr:phasin family protein [Sphingomonas sp.]